MTQLATVALPDNIYWGDEFDWSPVAQAGARTLTGAHVIEETPNQGGRPITLKGAWVERSTVEALRALEEQVATEMALTLPDGRQFTVVWRRGSNPGVSAAPLFPTAESDATTIYTLTLRLMEAAP